MRAHRVEPRRQRQHREGERHEGAQQQPQARVGDHGCGPGAGTGTGVGGGGCAAAGAGAGVALAAGAAAAGACVTVCGRIAALPLLSSPTASGLALTATAVLRRRRVILAEPHQHHLGIGIDVRQRGGAHLRERLHRVAVHLGDPRDRIALGEHPAQAGGHEQVAVLDVGVGGQVRQCQRGGVARRRPRWCAARCARRAPERRAPGR